MPDAPTTPEVIAPEVTPEEAPTTAATSEPDWLPERLARAKRSAQAELLKELGVDDLASAKSVVEEANRLKAEQMTDAQRAIERAEKAEARALELEEAAKARDLADMRRKVIAETGLPEGLADRLTGDDEEALRADAKSLLASIPAATQPLPDAAGNVPPAPTADPDVEAFSRAAFGG